MSRICACIVTYRAPEKLKRILADLDGQTTAVEQIVRDNSEDDLHYTEGMNWCLRRALRLPVDYFLLLADDVKFDSCDLILRLQDFLDSHPKTGMVSPIHLDEKGKVILAACANSFPHGMYFSCERGNAQDTQSHWLNTSCVLIRREALEECGLLDKNMRFICSDSDYSFTLRARGWETWITADAAIIHEPGAAKENVDPELNRIKLEDCLYFMRKWMIADLFPELEYGGKPADIEKRYRELLLSLR